MENSGFADLLASKIISMADSLGPHALLAIIFILQQDINCISI